MKMWMLATVAILIAGCAHSLDELAPYPCALDDTCPDGLACHGGTCLPATVGDACDLSTDCRDAFCYIGGVHDVLDGGGTGTCRLTCTGDAQCPDGSICTSQDQHGTCVDECTTSSATCAPGFTCQARGFDARRACLPNGSMFPTCARVDAQQCACGADDESVQCSGSAPCPSHSICGSGTCTCESGYLAFSCDGQSCSSVVCMAGNAHCLPIDSGGDPTCGSADPAYEGNCMCADGRVLPFACGETTSCEAKCRP